MAEIIVAFEKASIKNFPWGAAIAYFTRPGPYCHTEIVFEGPPSNALCFSSTIETGVRFTHRDVSGPEWVLHHIDCPDHDLAKMREAADAMVAKKLGYDLPAFVDFLLDRDDVLDRDFQIHDDHERFCSEACTEVLRAVWELDPRHPAYRMSPNDLARELNVPLA